MKFTGTENRMVFARRVGEMGTVVKKVQTSSYKINKFWGCKVHHGDHN